MSGKFSENSKKKAPMHLAPGLPDNFDNFINLGNRTLQQER
jgi:hypothetical protein